MPVGRVVRSARQGEVVQAGDAEHRVVHAVALQAAVAENLPALHAGEGVLDAGPHLFVGAVVFLLPVRELVLALRPAVRHHQTGARIAAVRDGHRRADGVLRAGFRPRLAVVAVTGQRPTTTTSRVSASMTI